MSAEVAVEANSAAISPSIKVNNFTEHEKHIQQVLAVACASTSMLFSLVTFYWFVRMRRSFRHHLIMLLIASDMFKAVWYFAPAVIILSRGRPISQGLCQSTGFLLALGVEASDFTIILIAIHTALSVLRPRESNQDSGLFHVRYQAYVCWAIFSVLLAGIAFVDARGNGYISQGTFCYLPVRPIWYRLVLSWVPRYVILVTILVIYIVIYVYTKSKFGEFDTDFSSGSTTSERGSSNNSGSHYRRATAPSSGKDVDPTTTRGLDGSTPSRQVENNPPEHKFSSLKYSLTKATHTRTVTFDGISSNESSRMASPQQQRAIDSLADTAFRTPTLLEALHDRSLSALALNRRGEDPHVALYSRHKVIERQLRYMFIYPLVYLVMWVPPFVNHCYFYTAVHDPPFTLNCFSVSFLSLQCAVDCLVFCLREKPWRYAAKAEARERRKVIVNTSCNAEMRPVLTEGFTLPQIQKTGNRESQPLQTLSALSSVPSPRRERFWWDEEEH